MLKKAGYWKYQITEYLRSFALQRRWIGQADYTRFIVLGRSRVGSNLLRGLLNDHSQIVVLGELFQNKQAIGWAMDGFPTNGRTRQMFLQEPVPFLEEKVWRHFPQPVTAVGFKIFYYHARDRQWAAVWPYLQADTDLRVIHIKRRNLLNVHLSRKRAMVSDEWVNTAAGKRTKVGAISLDYEECLQDFEQTRQYEVAADAFFAGHPKIDVIYETLAAGREQEMARIQSFLGVNQEVVTPQTFKQAKKPLSAAITNFETLKAQFAGSPWESFFEESA